MRIWDIHPGYLNRQSLLGEHRELHGIVSIFIHDKKGYSRHPETLRWKGLGWALNKRHQLLSAEMSFRGYQDRSPVELNSREGQWPEIFIDEPHLQFELLGEKYKYKELGRIPLPENAQQLWSQHKYSVMARDPGLYKDIGRSVSLLQGPGGLIDLSVKLVKILQTPPSSGGLYNSLQHMWGHVSSAYKGERDLINQWPPQKLLSETQKLVISGKEPYLMSSTAISELAVWC